jgi:hypothetical protein
VRRQGEKATAGAKVQRTLFMSHCCSVVGEEYCRDADKWYGTSGLMIYLFGPAYRVQSMAPIVVMSCHVVVLNS